jgi:hypothetical protein
MPPHSRTLIPPPELPKPNILSKSKMSLKDILQKNRISIVRALANHPSYWAPTASDTLLQAIDLAVAAEEIGLDGAYFRVHHFASQLTSPFSVAFGYRCPNKIEIGTTQA